MSVKILYYFGTNPTEDFAGVPSGATYSLQNKNTVVIFEEDEATLRARKDGQGRVLFHDSPTRPTPVRAAAQAEEDAGPEETKTTPARKVPRKGGD